MYQDPSTLCADGFYLYQTGRGSMCMKCPWICRRCTDFGVCTSCVDGYLQNSEPACSKCDAKCEKCTRNADRSSKCDKCLPGLFPSGATCIVCPSTQWFNYATGLCQSCTISGCSKCLTATTCFTCDASYTLGLITLYDNHTFSNVQTQACIPKKTAAEIAMALTSSSSGF